MTNIKAHKRSSEGDGRDNATRRLDVIIFLLARSYMAANEMSMKQIIDDLDSIGLRDTEIANIFGKTRSYISKELVHIRKVKTVKNNKIKAKGGVQ